MNETKRFRIPTLFLLVFSILTGYADTPLMRDGKSACTIIVKKDAGVVEKHAAAELAKYLGRIAGGKAPDIASTPVSGSVPVRFALTKDKRVADEGFMISADGKSLTISGRQEIGFLYGAYEILKKYGGIRFLVPGEDGEYFKLKSTIAVPDGTLISNPSFAFRNINWGGASIASPKWDSFDWMVRNGLRNFDIPQTHLHPELRKGLDERGGVIQAGGHCFSDLLGGNLVKGKTYREFDADLRRMFREHPEYFPFINGKRIFLDGHKYQPCTSNPEVVRIMSENLIWILRNICSQTPGGRYRLVNNDGTGWCQCENCQKLDLGSKLMVNRYWTFINELAARAYQAVPDAIINTIAYQNYEAAPTEVLPDKRIATEELSFNRICYRHKLDDPDCLTNSRYLKQYQDWAALAKKQGYQLVAYAQIDSLGTVFMPIEEVYIHDMKLYHKLGIIGLRPQICPPDGKYSKRYDSIPMAKLSWYGMWQTMYLFAAHAWDINADTAAITEEINSLYYGEKAWNAGMREFRRLLSKAFRETPGCYGHGHSSPLGRCLDAPDMQRKLAAALDAAEKAASRDPDPRALRHVKRERLIYSLTWEKFRKEYVSNYREVQSYRRTAPVKIDGILDDPDWKNADTTGGFKICYGERASKEAENQTYIKIFHEPENIYFGIEAMEKTPEKMTCNIRKHDGPLWEDNTVELFLTHPDLGNAYYQIIINPAGVVFDQFVSPGSKPDAAFESGIEVKTKVLKDRWIIEARIPTGPLGEKCFDGQAWKINVLRSRKLNGVTTHSGIPVESSTWSYGNPHDVGKFHPVNFCPGRNITIHGKENDMRVWRNGSLNEPAKKPVAERQGEWTVKNGQMPAHWHPAGRKGAISYETDRNSPDNRFIRFSGTLINNYYSTETGKKVSIHLRMKGKAEIALWWYCYKVENGKRQFIRSVPIGSGSPATSDWKSCKYETVIPKADFLKLAIQVQRGELMLDDTVIQ